MSLLAETRCTGLFCYGGGVNEGAFVVAVVVVVVVASATYVCLSYKGLCYPCFLLLYSCCCFSLVLLLLMMMMLLIL